MNIFIGIFKTYFFSVEKILVYQFYIFQLEEYDVLRFFKTIFFKGLFPTKFLRKKPVFTVKGKILLLLSIILKIFFTSLFIYLLHLRLNLNYFLFIFLFFLIYFILSVFSFIFLLISQIVIFPLELWQKKRIINKAKQKIKYLIQENIVNNERIPSKLRIIGITGSYGKTTMKEVVYEVLSKEFSVVKTKGNNNTPLAISKLVLNEVNENTEILIIEMGEYVKGDVKKICEITPPSISIITGINEAHLERYKTMQNAISTKFEIVEYSQLFSLVFLNADDEVILNNYKNYIRKDNILSFYSSKIKENDSKNSLFFELPMEYISQMLKIKNYEFHEDGSGQSFEIYHESWSLGKVKVSHIAEYIIGYINCAVAIARAIGMSESKIRIGISSIKPVPHRLEPKFIDKDIIIIDDTYNGNSNGIFEGLKILEKFKNRRKIYITPGLVETGYLTKDIHINIGESISKVADLVFLISNSVTNYLLEGLKKGNFQKEKIIIYPNAKVAYEDMWRYLQKGDVVLMQNDWSDNYY